MAQTNPVLELLKDGELHSRTELLEVMGLTTDSADLNNLAVNLYYLRKKLRPKSQTILREMSGRHKAFYRHVKIVPITEVDCYV